MGLLESFWQLELTVLSPGCWIPDGFSICAPPGLRLVKKYLLKLERLVGMCVNRILIRAHAVLYHCIRVYKGTWHFTCSCNAENADRSNPYRWRPANRQDSQDLSPLGLPGTPLAFLTMVLACQSVTGQARNHGLAGGSSCSQLIPCCPDNHRPK